LSTVDLKTQIIGLVKLQELDSQIYALRNEKEAKPLELQKQRKEKELELATNAEAVKKLQTQLYSLKTNKEFQTMLQQIADTKADGSLIEEKILMSFDDSDKIKAQIDQENIKLKSEEKVFLEKKKSIELRIKEIDERLNQLQEQRKQITPGIDPKMLAEYDRILSSRDGLAIVTVIDNSCGGCHMLVPPQVINLIKMYEHIVTCEVCNRIFYIAE
jgi:hypothetical protein